MTLGTGKKLSIIIPAYNEEKTIHLILDRLAVLDLAFEIEKELVVVNDCSVNNIRKSF